VSVVCIVAATARCGSELVMMMMLIARRDEEVEWALTPASRGVPCLCVCRTAKEWRPCRRRGETSRPLRQLLQRLRRGEPTIHRSSVIRTAPGASAFLTYILQGCRVYLPTAITDRRTPAAFNCMHACQPHACLLMMINYVLPLLN